MLHSTDRLLTWITVANRLSTLGQGTNDPRAHYHAIVLHVATSPAKDALRNASTMEQRGQLFFR